MPSRLPQLLFSISLFCLPALFADISEYRAPLLSAAPVLDGKIEKSEWADAVRIDGFTAASGPGVKRLERRRASAWIGATETHIFIAIRSQLPKEGSLLAEAGPDTPPSRLLHDDLVEIWVSPDIGQQSGRNYQMAVNPEGHRFFNVIGYGGEPDDPQWKADWESAGSQQEGYWEFEAAIPIESIAPGRKATDGAWGINVCRNWQQPWIFSSINPAGRYTPDDRFTFVKTGAPSVTLKQKRDPFAGEIENVFQIQNSTSAPLELKAGLLLESETMPEVVVDEEFQLAPGDSREILLRVNDTVTRGFRQTATIQSMDGKIRFFDRTTEWTAQEPDWQWTTTHPAPALPVDFDFAYYPSKDLLRVLVDISNLPADAELRELLVTVRETDGETIQTATLDMDAFDQGRQEALLALPELEGRYEISAKGEGNNVPEVEVVKTFERLRFPWEGNPMGRSTKIYPPFTPIAVEGNSLKTVLRKHELNTAGLWDQVTATNPETGITKSLLAAPMRWEAVIEAAPQEVESEQWTFTEKAEHEVRTKTKLSAGPLQAEVKNTWDYDGTMRTDLTLLTSGGKQVDALTLVIPLRDEKTTHYHAMGDTLRAYPRTNQLPEGEGIIWTASEVLVQETPENFCTYILLGSPSRALSWFAENDFGWSWDPETPNLEVVRENGQVQLRVHLINQPVVIEEPRTITFGLLAAPVKPRLGEDWRHKWRRDNYTMLAGSINWFGFGLGGGLYPPEKDFWFWHMLRKGNSEVVSRETVEEVGERGIPHWEPYGEEYVQRWLRHVPRNMQGRYGQKMVFYYNRSSHQFAEEFQTFQDEWALTDFRTVGPGNSIEEIKIIPSNSYIDMALYWYAKGIEHGGNLGVYWDNWYHKAGFNTAMTAAYRKQAGSIVPSTGIWELRELAKRTFVMMNELGMVPIVMAHMTGTNILPMLSFVTVQLDWEWKQAERYGNVQDRHERDYILMVSLGELAGTWPVVLGDATNDDWLQRTYAAVSIVHELDNRRETVDNGLFDPIDSILAEPGVKAFRYWDERPQPIRTANPNILPIVYSVEGKRAIFAVTSFSDEDSIPEISIDAKALGFANGFRMTDVETNEEIPVKNDKATFPLKTHDIRIFEILPQ